MKRVLLASLILAGLLFVTGCGSSTDLSLGSTQRDVGVRMAKMNLWREAQFRFQREVQINPDNAMAHNNLAVASEANGDFETAAKEYREALRLDRTNTYIQKNYSRFVEFTQRGKRRSGETAAPAAATQPGAQSPANPAASPMPDASSAEPAAAPPPPPPGTATTTTNSPEGALR